MKTYTCLFIKIATLTILILLDMGCGSYKRWYNYQNEEDWNSLNEEYIQYRISGPDDEHGVSLSVDIYFKHDRIKDSTFKNIFVKNGFGQIGQEDSILLFTRYFDMSMNFVGDSIKFTRDKFYSTSPPGSLRLYFDHPKDEGYKFKTNVPQLEVEMKLRIGLRTDGTDSLYVIRRVLKSNIRYREVTIHG